VKNATGFSEFPPASPVKNAIRTLLCGLVLATAIGCEVDSFMDPSRTGRFEYEPTTIPVLERIDVIEPHKEFWANATPPTSDDLMPRELAYYIYPGDVVTVSVFELQQPNIWSTTTRRVDTAGFFRVPELGDVRAAGLTAQQFQDEVKRQVAERIMTNPQVDVVVEQGGGLRYTVYGFVGRTGQYTLDQPNLRLIEALASAGGVPVTTERVYVIRQIILSPEVQPIFERDTQPGAQPQPAPVPPTDIDELIRQLENPPEAPPPSSQPEVRPGMLQEAPNGDQPPPNGDQPPPPNGAEPPIDIDALEPPAPTEPPVSETQEMEPVRAPEQPPVDVDVVRPPVPPLDDTGETLIYIPERGEWVRVPRAAGAQPPPSEPSLPREAPHVLDRVIVIDYDRLSKGDSSQDIVVRPSDKIYVDGPPQGFFYIDGEIARIGVYQLPGSGTLTLSRAVSAAGGLGPIAIPSRVDLTRKIGPYREATIRLDLAAIRQRTEPDVVIKPDDHIIIGTSFFATPIAIIRNGFRATYGFGFLLDRNFGTDVFGPQEFSGF
jgi:polysaccharide export outer membrane protein